MEEQYNSTHENQLTLLAIPDLYDKNFFIPDYQRGYRWGDRQVEQLLEDLTEFFSNDGKGSFYCLQPIVVREMRKEEVEGNKLMSQQDENRWYEVIDGQQRLTTIRIILELLTKINQFFKRKYNICYQTRPTLGDFFDTFKIDVSQDPYDVNVIDPDHLNIDSWHIYRAAQRVLDWFKHKYNEDAGISIFNGTFQQYFTSNKNQAKSVQVIWYELRDGSDPSEAFKRLNEQKVGLNNAELIRAMFLSDSAKYEIDEKLINNYQKDLRPVVEERERARRQSHIIEQWDLIEKQLRQDKFWAFVKDDGSTEGYSCRIEYLFDLISGKQPTEKDELYTYLYFEEMIKKGDVKGLWGLWMKIENNFAILQSWYLNREYYHKIGYLIAEKGTRILVELLNEATKQTKSFFAKNVNWRIKEHMLNAADDDIFKYSYESSEQYMALKRILFFYNVEATRKSSTQDFFPFQLYKAQSWTLEHIHAQNSERIDRNDKKKWETWLEENKNALNRLKNTFKEGDEQDPRSLIIKIEKNQQDIQKTTYTFESFVAVFDDVSLYYDKMAISDGGTPRVHNISNMALLSGDVNTSIGNTVFEVKRQSILKADADGKYIPYCTRLVFLKYYNKDNEDFSVQHMYYWSEKDRECYSAHISETLKDILDAKNPQNND